MLLLLTLTGGVSGPLVCPLNKNRTDGGTMNPMEEILALLRREEVISVSLR